MASRACGPSRAAILAKRKNPSDVHAVLVGSLYGVTGCAGTAGTGDGTAAPIGTGVTGGEKTVGAGLVPARLAAWAAMGQPLAPLVSCRRSG